MLHPRSPWSGKDLRYGKRKPTGNGNQPKFGAVRGVLGKSFFFLGLPRCVFVGLCFFFGGGRRWKQSGHARCFFLSFLWRSAKIKKILLIIVVSLVRLVCFWGSITVCFVLIWFEKVWSNLHITIIQARIWCEVDPYNGVWSSIRFRLL